MAPVSTDNDFLDDALKNKTILPSWRSISTRLASPNPPAATTLARITTFLSSESSLHTLKNCHNPFPRPSAASKQEFERLTAPINFTAADQPSTPNGTTPGTLPPFAELKTSALDFSKTLNIDEVSALRIVVLEHQGRPAKDLLAAEAGAGGEGDLVSGSFGASLLESIFTPNQVDGQKQRDDKIFFDRVEVYMSERRYVLKVAAALVRASISGPTSKNNVWGDLGAQFAREALVPGWADFALKLVAGIDARWYEAGTRETGLPEWLKKRMEDSTIRHQVAYAWEKQTFLEIIHLLQLLFILLYKPAEDVNAKLVKDWFLLMTRTQFFGRDGRLTVTFPDEPEIRNFYVYSGRLASMVSLAILQIPKTLKVLSDDISTSTPSAPTTDRSFYIKDPSAIVAITNCMQESAGNYTSSSFAVIGWTWILKYIQALVRENTVWDEGDEFAAVSAAVEQYQNLLPQLFPSTVDVGLRNLGTRAVGPMQHDTIIAFEPSGDGSSGSDFRLGCEEDGLRMKNVLADLVRRTQGYFDFSGNLITSCFLTTDIEYSDVADFKRFMEQDTTNEEDSSESWTGSPARRFLGDDGTQQLLLRAKNRFPHEPLPFMRLVRGLATEDTQIVDFLLNMDTYTQSLPSGFKDYDDYGDEESGNIQLASDLDLFPAREGGMFELDDSDSGSFSSHGGIRIPSGTQGVQISSGGVVAWKHSYNALALFGRILETGADTQPGGELETLVNPETVTEIVSILTVLVACSSEAAAASARKPGQYEIPRVIGEASEMLRRNRDVISVIFDILDTAMNRYTIDNPFFVVGLEFVDSLVNLAPGRVWPYLARSVLLERQGRGGAFSGYLTAVEVVQGSYDFTLACLTLFEHLVDEAIRSAAVHKGRSKSLVHPSSKTAPQGPGGMGVSDVVQRDILLGFTRVVVDIFESYRGFKYVKDIAQKLDIGTKIARIFTTILYNVYGVDESSDIENKITSVLGPSAEYLVSVFLSAGTSDLPIEPIMAAIMDGVQTPETSLYLKNLGKWVEQVVQVVRFADVLVRVRLYLGHPPSQLERQLYAGAASMAKLYAADDKYKKYTLELLESLVKSSGSFPEEPPSLLGHLGGDCANHFVTLLSTLDKPYQDDDVETRIWNFISAVVSNKQQGMSILLLRGEALRQGPTAGKSRAVKNKSMLSICFDALEDIDRLPVEKTLAMLEMVSTAQNFWTLAMDDLGKHPKFLSGLTKHVENFNIEFLPADSKEIITEKACKVAIAGHIARILALYLHSRRPSDKDQEFFKQLLPRLNFYFAQAVKITGYRTSLHVHLMKNFEDKFPGLKLAQMKKTRLRRTVYGADAVYDMTLGDKVLGFDPVWSGRLDGYKNELEAANLNLSLVQTQVDLLSSWEFLAIELCDFAKNSRELTDSLVGMVETCLVENVVPRLPVPIFSQIVASRAEFAFVVVRKLHQAKPDEDLFTHVFKVALKAIHDRAPEFHHALSTGEMDYFRSLLRIIYISLTAAAKQPKPSSLELGPLVIELLEVVVAKGFKDLATAAHQHPDRANPQDIALVTGILQAALRINGIGEIHTDLANHLQENETISAATTLFSWSEQLAGGESGDPVYAELSVLFLLELSAVPAIAQQLAVDGILDRLTSTTLAARIVAHGVTPQTDPRLHAIWARGLLPLALNLLANIGHRFGREIITFLRFFEPQIGTAIEGWRKPVVIVLPAVNESVAIGMLVAIVQRMGGKQELAQLKFDTAVVANGVDYLLTHRNYLKSLVTATNVDEEEMLRDESETGLVEKVVVGLETVRQLLQDDVEGSEQ